MTAPGLQICTTAAASASPSPLPTAATAATLGLPPLPRLCYAALPAETGLSRTQSLLIRLVGEVMDTIAKKEGGDKPVAQITQFQEHCCAFQEEIDRLKQLLSTTLSNT
ncbi:hypothetical protein Pelo_17638 [Pelomyxa schiedti]|nr:hypothetical protein Pelo_17638 [Pelomyxa schiedti]